MKKPQPIEAPAELAAVVGARAALAEAEEALRDTRNRLNATTTALDAAQATVAALAAERQALLAGASGRALEAVQSDLGRERQSIEDLDSTLAALLGIEAEREAVVAMIERDLRERIRLARAARFETVQQSLIAAISQHMPELAALARDLDFTFTSPDHLLKATTREDGCDMSTRNAPPEVPELAAPWRSALLSDERRAALR